MQLLYTFPWTISFAAVFIIVNAVSLYKGGALIHPQILKKFGISNSHLYQLMFLRILTSVFFTHTWKIFFWALFIVTLINSTSELLFSTQLTIAVFFISHILTIITTSKITWLAQHFFNHKLLKTIHTTVDVGPSAAYYGLGSFLLTATLEHNLVVFFLIPAILLFQPTYKFFTYKSMQSEQIVASMYHFVAYVVGIGLAYLFI